MEFRNTLTINSSKSFDRELTMGLGMSRNLTTETFVEDHIEEIVYDKNLKERLVDFISILKVRLGFYHNNSLVYTNKRLFSLSVVALFLLGSYTFVQIYYLGSIDNFYTSTISINKLPKNHLEAEGSYGFMMEVKSPNSDFCDKYN